MSWYDAAELAADYGFSKAFFASDPELQKLLNKAVSNQWDEVEFQAAFMQTAWYRARSASIRQWFDLATRDPAEAQAKILARAAEFKDTLSQYGVELDDAAITALATQSLQYAWTPTQTTDILTGYVNYLPGQMGGTPAAVEMKINQLLNDYGLTATGTQVGSWVQGVMNQRLTEDNIRSTFRDMAKSKYVGSGAMLDMGFTMRDIASPYIQSYAQLMEVNPDTVQLNNNLIQNALQGSPPNPGDAPQMKSVYQFERDVRRDPQWLRTKNARTQMVDATQSILRDWGLVG